MLPSIILRTQISLTEAERKRLGRRDLKAMRGAAGSWADIDTDGGAYVEQLRSGARLEGLVA